MTSPLALSGNATIRTETFGRERLPMLVVEDALEDLALVREIAARHSFQPIGPHYPGIRAAVSERIAMPLVASLAEQMQAVFGLERTPAYHECYLSLVTKAPGELAPIQRLPHFDGVERERIAALLYLDPQRRGGTAFYRQRATGFEYVDEARFETYERALRAGVEEHGLPDAGYIDATSPLFERVFEVEDRPNRLVIYRGNTLHCAALEEGFRPDPDPATGRLSLNLFLRG